MYEAEYIPNVIPMGISYKDFWSFTPRELNVTIEGYKIGRKVEDEKQWFLGGYVFNAVSIAIANAFRKKNSKPENYFELLPKPLLSSVSEEMSEEEKKKYTDAFLANLHVMETNFNMSHGK